MLRRTTVTRGSVLGYIALLGSIILVGGCFSSHPEDIQAFAKPYEVNVTTDKYVMQPPDEVEIHCAQVVEINMQREKIRPDGKISFERLGEFDVAGKTCKEVADRLRERVSRLYTLSDDNAIDVRIAVYSSQFIYVLGQVMRPGPRIYSGREGVFNALAEAQPNPMAWKERVQVIRPSSDENEAPKIFEVNWDKMAAHGDLRDNVLLQEGDVIFVPPTILAGIGMVLEEFISPVARAFYGWYLVQNPPTGTQAYSPSYSR
jgi:protein involved in polysaccharide export with SLBB domain